jgi:biopolymer transport protein ExbB
VLAYNWLIRRNKTIMEDLGAFTNDVHGYLASAGAVKPLMASPAPAAQTRSGAAPTQRGSEPVRPGMTPTGAQASPNPTTR